MYRLIWMIKSIYCMLGLLFRPSEKRFLLAAGERMSETKAFEISLEKIKGNKNGLKLLQNRYHGKQPSLQALSHYPRESLGYLVAQHFIVNKLEFYERIQNDKMSDIQYVKERSREFHDILHVVYGYGTSIVDEISLNVILMAQTQYPMSILVVAGGILRTLFTAPNELNNLLSQIRRAWSLAASSPLVFSIQWEDEWMTPLDSLRKSLGIERSYLARDESRHLESSLQVTTRPVYELN